ncbi:MAG TPA: hypothetical protein VFV92_04935, partial [Candidatus Bathyarchaeia archaeon]|nr:hypothetical protein [Candidatus Bathyarchaeia archaeon]
LVHPEAAERGSWYTTHSQRDGRHTTAFLGSLIFKYPDDEVSSWRIEYRARKLVVKVFTFATATSGRRSLTWIHRLTFASICRKIGSGSPTMTVW